MAERAITAFRGKYWFLSNFYAASGSGHHRTVEHRFQSIKAADEREAAWVRSAPNPVEAKRRGGLVRMRPDWDEIRVGVMETCLRDKFATNPLQRMLLATGDAHLEEGNTWGDRFWGTVNGVGENMLGKLLMKIRDEIRAKDIEEWGE